jgi:hypothetical protein
MLFLCENDSVFAQSGAEFEPIIRAGQVAHKQGSTNLPPNPIAYEVSVAFFSCLNQDLACSKDVLVYPMYS